MKLLLLWLAGSVVVCWLLRRAAGAIKDHYRRSPDEHAQRRNWGVEA
jgi:hypothetical protein